MRAKFGLAATLAIGLAALGLSYTSVKAQTARRTVSDGVYTAEQAARGRTLYQARCAVCHGDGLEGADVNPPLAGARFMSNWRGQSVGDLVARTRTTMPLDDPGSLSADAVADVTAYILMVNHFPRGSAALPRDAQAQRQIRIAPRT